jgi:hypothetical protein
MAVVRTSVGAALLLEAIALGACADEPTPGAFVGPWIPSPDIAIRAELTCATDGSAALSTDTLQPQPNGIHIRVINEFDEPVSVAGLDADPGTTNYVFTGGPGTMELMCWPFSEHGSGDAPDRLRLKIVDPLGLHVSGELPCEIESHTISDYFEAPIDEGPPPLDVARRSIEGLRPDGVLRVDGYPEQEGGSVIVIRDGEIVATYGIKRFKGEPWDLISGSACEGSGLPFEGESIG